MKKAIIIVMLIMFLVSCGPQPVKEIKIHTGSEGLVVQFDDDSPPNIVFEEEAIPINLRFFNRGAYDINGGFYSISVEKQYLGLDGDNVDSFNINGKTRYNPYGGELLVRRGAFTGVLDPMTETITSRVSVTICYPYQTTATINACIDTDLFNQNTQKVCRPDDIMFEEGGQGGPVGIVRVEPKMKHNSEDPTKVIPQFVIYIANMGVGQCVEPSKIRDSCIGGSIEPKYWNTAVVKAYLVDQQLDCTPKLDPESEALEGHIKFSRDETREDFIRCELTEGIPKTAGTYTSALKIDIDYGYTETISKNIEIRKV